MLVFVFTCHCEESFVKLWLKIFPLTALNKIHFFYFPHTVAPHMPLKVEHKFHTSCLNSLIIHQYTNTPRNISYNFPACFYTEMTLLIFCKFLYNLLFSLSFYWSVFAQKAAKKSSQAGIWTAGSLYKVAGVRSWTATHTCVPTHNSCTYV